AGRLVSVNDGVALATGYGNWCDFPFEAAVFGGGTRAAQRFERECVLRFTAEVVLVGTGFGKHAHGCPALVGVFEAVECHVVVHGGMAIAVALASTQQQVGCIAHAFLATSHDDIDAFGLEKIVAKHGGLHARTADLVNRSAAHALGKAGTQCSLARRSLALAGLQHVTHDDFVDGVGGDTRALDSCLDGDGAQLMRCQTGKTAHHAAHGCTGDGNKDDGIRHVVAPDALMVISRGLRSIRVATKTSGGIVREDIFDASSDDLFPASLPPLCVQQTGVVLQECLAHPVVSQEKMREFFGKDIVRAYRVPRLCSQLGFFIWSRWYATKGHLGHTLYFIIIIEYNTTQTGDAEVLV